MGNVLDKNRERKGKRQEGNTDREREEGVETALPSERE